MVRGDTVHSTLTAATVRGSLFSPIFSADQHHKAERLPSFFVVSSIRTFCFPDVPRYGIVCYSATTIGFRC